LFGRIYKNNSMTKPQNTFDVGIRLSKMTLKQFEEKYTLIRPRTCLDHCEARARGKNKMRRAKQTILRILALPKEMIAYTVNCARISVMQGKLYF